MKQQHRPAPAASRTRKRATPGTTPQGSLGHSSPTCEKGNQWIDPRNQRRFVEDLLNGDLQPVMH